VGESGQQLCVHRWQQKQVNHRGIAEVRFQQVLLTDVHAGLDTGGADRPTCLDGHLRIHLNADNLRARVLRRRAAADAGMGLAGLCSTQSGLNCDAPIAAAEFVEDVSGTNSCPF
jgi:hypothetical protein